VSGKAESVTALLRRWSAGDRAAHDEVVPVVHAELKKIAEAYMRRESAAATLSTTELVAEAYERLRDDDAQWNDRVHFFAVAARHMRQILVDHARRRLAAKRGGGAPVVELDETHLPDERPDDIIALDDALAALAELDERKARAVELYYFAGLTYAEIGDVLAIDGTTVAREMRSALAWLKVQLRR
jgi:RNA polymerase sigma factor (TIGR02999 family)